MISSNRLERLLSVCRKQLERCSYRYKLCAVIMSKNKIISTGINSTKSYPFLTRYFLHGTVHAEIAAMIPIMHYDDLRNLSMFVMRENHDGELRNARPCPMCIQAMYEFGSIKDVCWTTDRGTLEYDRIDHMYNQVMQIDKTLRYTMNGKELRSR